MDCLSGSALLLLVVRTRLHSHCQTHHGGHDVSARSRFRSVAADEKPVWRRLVAVLQAEEDDELEKAISDAKLLRQLIRAAQCQHWEGRPS